VVPRPGRLFVSLLTVSLLGLAAWGAAVRLRGARDTRPALTPAALDDLARRSTVILTSGPCQGSGFFVTADLLLTNAHVLCAETADARVGPATIRATIVEIDDELDLALLVADGAGGTPLRLADAMTVREGDRIATAGAPAGHDVQVIPGTVTRPFTRLWGVLHIESDVAVDPGNSGGPLLNDRGEAIGVVSKRRTTGGRRWALALPVNYASAWLPDGVALPQDARWDARVAEAARHAERDVSRFQAALERPILLGAQFLPLPRAATPSTGDHALVFVVAAPVSTADAEVAQLTVQLTCGDTRPNVSALSTWQRIDRPLEDTPMIDVTQLRPFLAWARKHSFADGLVVAAGVTRITRPPPCPTGQLALLDGGAVTSTVVIE
jgi:hypothetical protein